MFVDIGDETRSKKKRVILALSDQRTSLTGASRYQLRNHQSFGTSYTTCSIQVHFGAPV